MSPGPAGVAEITSPVRSPPGGLAGPRPGSPRTPVPGLEGRETAAAAGASGSHVPMVALWDELHP